MSPGKRAAHIGAQSLVRNISSLFALTPHVIWLTNKRNFDHPHSHCVCRVTQCSFCPQARIITAARRDIRGIGDKKISCGRRAHAGTSLRVKRSKCIVVGEPWSRKDLGGFLRRNYNRVVPWSLRWCMYSYQQGYSPALHGQG